MSSAWLPARGLREICSTSSILFNIYHHAVMRQPGRLGKLPRVLRWGLNGDGYQEVRLRGQVHEREMGVRRKRYGFGSYCLWMILRLWEQKRKWMEE